MLKNNQNTGGFTLIEVLVVVLIIGILTSVALPQYTKSVEKARAAEGLQIVRQIQDAQLIFYATYNRWATQNDWDALDISIPETGIKSNYYNRPTTKYFSFSPHGAAERELAVVWRLPEMTRYYFISYTDDPGKIICVAMDGAPSYDKKMCEHFNATGTL